MKLALISAKFPYGPKEPYLDAELRALAPSFERICVFPTSPTDATLGFRNVAAEVRRLGLFAPRTLAGACAAIVRRPRASVGAIAALFSTPYALRVKLKNLAVLPLGLAIGDALRRERFDHVHAYWLSTPATVAFIAARVAGIPWSSTGHLWDIYEDNALRLKLPSARFVRAISERGRSDLLRTPGVAGRADVRTVHVGVTVAPGTPKARTKQPGQPLTLLCAANLVRKKGHRDLLAGLALARTRGVALQCTIAGDGELRDELQARARELGLDDVVGFRGSVPHATLLGELRDGAYDAMALTSLELPGGEMEGIPVALMEAMAAGVPVVTTRTGSITELVDASCGRVVEQGDVDAIAAAIAELAGDPALRARLAHAAYDRVRTRFNVEVVAAELARAIGAA